VPCGHFLDRIELPPAAPSRRVDAETPGEQHLAKSGSSGPFRTP
jgi:hypothetical protein